MYTLTNCERYRGASHKYRRVHSAFVRQKLIFSLNSLTLDFGLFDSVNLIIPLNASVESMTRASRAPESLRVSRRVRKLQIQPKISEKGGAAEISKTAQISPELTQLLSGTVTK